MSLVLAALVSVPTVLLLLCGFLPSVAANHRAHAVRRYVTWIAGIQCLAAIAALIAMLPGLLAGAGAGAQVVELFGSGMSIYLDGFSLLMLALVSFVGVVVCQYSIRYLDGDPNQGRFFHWIALTIGAVSMFVVSGNLAMLLIAWVLTSFGLHHLLLHYPDRKAAKRTAWTKFAISRVGDVFLIAAITLVWREFGTLALADIFAAVQSESFVASTQLYAISWLFMLCAVTKSAQFPVHSWLPDTLETPTPVSALMHAGIVNAGGYLVIRLSPIFVETPTVLGTLAIIGSITVGYAGIVMLTQTSIKLSLAYSTIAQMGFMMLQCGLGAFAAAMLHILAHSLYKAYAFLSSGSVLTEAAGRRKPRPQDQQSLKNVDVIGGFMLAGAAVAISSLFFGINLAEKPGGFVLGFVLTLALATWLWDVFRLESVRANLSGIIRTGGLALLYMAAYAGVSKLVAAGVPEFELGVMHTIAATDAFVMFLALMGISWCLTTQRGREIIKPMYVHASNGFYIDAWTRRLLSSAKS